MGGLVDGHQVSAIVEPTLPVAAIKRGTGCEDSGAAMNLISFTYYRDWTGFPVVSLPAGHGAGSGLPVGVSLIGGPRADPNLPGRYRTAGSPRRAAPAPCPAVRVLLEGAPARAPSRIQSW